MDPKGIRRNQKRAGKGRMIVSLVVVLLVVTFGSWYWCHPTCYKYNDRWIIGKDSSQIQEKYGTFDEKSEGGRKAGYYLYKDDGAVMPSHSAIYYWIYFNDTGKAEKVEKGGPIGG